MTQINKGLHQLLSHYNNTKKNNLYLTQKYNINKQQSLFIKTKGPKP